MDGIKTPELDKTFFIKDTEYRVSYKKDSGGKFSAEPHTKEGYYIYYMFHEFIFIGYKKD